MGCHVEVEELRLAREAAALLVDRDVVHQRPPGAAELLADSPDSYFQCDWCGRLVFMREMRSHGGKGVWSEITRERRETVLVNMREIGCWELAPP